MSSTHRAQEEGGAGEKQVANGGALVVETSLSFLKYRRVNVNEKGTYALLSVTGDAL